VSDGTEKKAAGAATFNDQVVRRGVALGDEMLGGGDEIGECVAFVVHAAGIVPRFAELAAAANVRDGVGDAAIKKTEALRAERNGDGDAIAAVAIQEQRRGSVTRSVTATNQGDGDRSAVGRGGVDAFADVLRWVVAA